MLRRAGTKRKLIYDLRMRQMSFLAMGHDEERRFGKFCTDRKGTCM